MNRRRFIKNMLIGAVAVPGAVLSTVKKPEPKFVTGSITVLDEDMKSISYKSMGQLFENEKKIQEDIIEFYSRRIWDENDNINNHNSPANA